jgi:CRISPR-associated protein Csd1
MILQELARYYERKTNDPETALAPEGFEKKEIPFVLVIDKNGGLVQIEDTRSGDGKKKRARIFMVPHGAKKSVDIAANLLWGTCEYAIGFDTKGGSKRVVKQHECFRSLLNDLPVQDAGVRAVCCFLNGNYLDQLKMSPRWDELRITTSPISFQLNTDTCLICERKAVIAAVMAGDARPNSKAEPTQRGVCLITGEDAQIERIHPPIKGVRGGGTFGQSIVCFNDRAYESYGKEKLQGMNAPISKRAAFAYTTALNHLLDKDSKQRIQVGDSTTVFWASADNQLVDSFASFFNEPDKDDPDANTSAVRALYRSVEQGSQNVSDVETRFFVLGLVAPDQARLSIRFWLNEPVEQLAPRIVEHFKDTSIVPFQDPRAKARQGRKLKEPLPQHLSLSRLLRSTALRDEAENIPPNLGGDTMRAILSGLPYPETLLLSAIRRIRAEQEVSYPRAALIKACINRKTRRAHPAGDSAPEEELHVSLDLANTNVGYRLGRLFAALEKVQEEASPGLNATIRDRFYGAASSTPVTVFSNLLKLSKHHLAKIENRGRAVNLEKLIGEIVDALNGDEGFTAHLTIANQGRFSIGYYHQKQAFYAKKSEPSEGVQA